MVKKAAKKSITKTTIYSTLAKRTGLARKDVQTCIDSLVSLIGEELGRKGPGKFTIPDMLAFTVDHYPAVEAHERPDAFNAGRIVEVKEKPASSKVKVRVLKGLKDML